MIYKGENSIKYLTSLFAKTDIGESSHWKKFNAEFTYSNDIFIVVTELKNNFPMVQ